MRMSFLAAIAAFALAACAPQATADPQTSPPPARTAASEGQMCGGIAGIACGEGLYCAYPNGHCGENDQSGQCRTLPTACTLEMAPVCGCDGRSYPNASCAAAAGVSVASQDYCARVRRAIQGR